MSLLIPYSIGPIQICEVLTSIPKTITLLTKLLYLSELYNLI